MRKKTADAQHCPACLHITEGEKYDYFCDYCEKILDFNNNPLMRHIDILPDDVENRHYESSDAEPYFCNMDCLFRWMRSPKYFEWRKLDVVKTGTITPFEFLSLQQMDRLVEELRK